MTMKWITFACVLEVIVYPLKHRDSEILQLARATKQIYSIESLLARRRNFTVIIILLVLDTLVGLAVSYAFV